MEILPSRQFPVLEMPANLKCQLMQYQNKTVSWCLSMENPNVKYEKVQVLWENISGQYVNRYTKAVKETNPEESLSGGILADEMGLGKTLMMLALMLLNKCQFKDFKKAGEYPYLLDSNPHQTLVPLHSTLIITPSAILYQWESEIQKHTTGVKVMVFKAGISDLQISDLEKYDIILASYDDLRKEFYASLQKSDRKLRKKPKIQVRKSLLNGILWWRVVMDEVQMVKNGVSNAAKMARCIPRIHSWGVSGTPFGKNGYNDLLNLLNFVDQESVILQNDTWRYLMENQEMMMDFLKRIMHRNLKDLVKNELVLSSQTESKIFLNLSPVENYYYNELLKKCKEEIKNIDSERQKDLENGVAPKVSVLSRLRMWLLQLRQTWYF
jgi:E3 ubiquitin-protein ligase SHPRH